MHLTVKGNDKKIKLLRKETFIIAAIVLLALTLRLICFSQLKADYPFFSNPVEGTDMFTAHQDAIDHLNGTFDRFPHYLNALYPYFLALIYFFFGPNILTAKIIQILLGCVNCVLIYFIAKEIFNKKVSLVASALTAAYMSFIIYNSILLVVTLLSFLIMLSLLLLLKIRKNPSYLLAIAAGIFMGLATLARGSSILFIPPAVLWLGFVLKGKGKKIILLPFMFLIFSLSVIGVITVQNYVLGDKFVLISANAGINFAIGNCPGAQGWVHYPDWLKQRQEKVSSEESSFWVKETFKSIQKEPLPWLRLMLKKFCLFWYYRELPNNIDQEFIRSHSWVLTHLPLLTFGGLVPLALVGMVLSFWQRKRTSLLYILLATYMSGVLISVTASRYRLPFAHLLIPFAAFTIYQGYIKLRRKDFKYIRSIILLAIPCLILTHAYDIYQELEKRLYVKSHPHGTYILSNNILTIQDNSRRWQGRTYAVLDVYKERVKKNLIINIDKDLSQIKKAYLELPFVCPRKEGEVTLEINNYPASKIKCAQIYSGEKVNSVKIPFDPSLLIQGENSFIFSVAEGGILIILIDNHYNYKRSAFSSNLGLVWDYTDLSPDREGKDKGEYMMSLYLEF